MPPYSPPHTKSDLKMDVDDRQVLLPLHLPPFKGICLEDFSNKLLCLSFLVEHEFVIKKVTLKGIKRNRGRMFLISLLRLVLLSA